MTAFLGIIRFKNLLMIALTMLLTKYAIISFYQSNHSLNTLETILLILSVIFIAAGGYVVNDIIDFKADKINKPKKVFVEKTISSKTSWLLYIYFTLVGISIGVYLSFFKTKPELSLYFIFIPIGLLLYSKYLKRLPVVGNILISILVPLVILLVYLFDGLQSSFVEEIMSIALKITLAQYMLFAFLTTLIRELIKDIEDINGDYALQMKTLPILFGVHRTKITVIVLSLVLILFLIFVFKSSIYNENYLLTLLVLLGIIFKVFIINKIWISKSKKDFSEISNFIKLFMLLGILSMIYYKFK